MYRALIVAFAVVAVPNAIAADAVDDFVRNEMSQQKVPGLTLAVVRNGQVVKAQGYGLANVEHQVPANRETVYQSGSVGKQFTATAVMMLVEDGKLKGPQKKGQPGGIPGKIAAGGAARYEPELAPRQEEVRGPPTLFIVGDSTVKNGTKGQMGWGDPIAGLFDKTRIKVENHALGGRSSRTFQTEGRWDKILASARPGDFVLVQMGHNDGGPLDDARRARGSIRGTGEETRAIDNPLTGKKETVHTYGWYLRKYVRDARAKGMTPILLSPIPHRPRQPVEKDAVEKNGYVNWAEEVARAEKVPFVNLNRLVLARYAGLAPADIKAKYFTPADDTHTSPAGAELNAAAVVEGLRGLKDCTLKDFLLPEKK